MRLVLGSLLLVSVNDCGESWFNIVNDYGEFSLYLVCVRYDEDSMRVVLASLLLNRFFLESAYDAQIRHSF